MVRQHMSGQHAPTLFRLPGDTEESVLGTNPHQQVIRELINSLEWAATRGPRWGVGGQTRIEGFRRSDGSEVPLLPDVFVYPHSWDARRGSLSIASDGPPLLTIEVTSDSTWQGDLNAAAGKVYSYGEAGIQEYVVFDPTGDLLPERVRAWRREDSRFVPWLPDSDGHWHSQQLGVAFGADGLFLRVYTGDGVPVEYDLEARAALAELRRQAARLTEQPRQSNGDGVTGAGEQPGQ